MTRLLPKPAIMVMHDYANIDPATKPAWGPVGSWMWWPWSSLNPSSGVYAWDVVDSYLDRAAVLGKPVALIVLVYPDTNADKTPAWVYGGGKGWPIILEGKDTGKTFPRINDGTWDAALQTFIAAFGARYDADPRVEAVWITFLRYGENLTDDLGSDSRNPGRYFANVVNWYARAFPTKPLCAIISGPTDRKKLAEQCWPLGIAPKFNALVDSDAPTHVMLKPTPGGGQAEIARESMARGIPTAWEHFYPHNESATYWAMLTAIALGATVIDLPIEHLDALASIPGLWEWTLEMMSYPQDRVGLWAARDTRYPPPGNGYEHGWPGPFERGIKLNAECYAPGSEGYKTSPVSLAGTVQGHGGIGWHGGAGPEITLSLPAGWYEVEMTYAPSADASQWRQVEIAVESPCVARPVEGPCWLHRVVARPIIQEEPPPPPDPPAPDWEALVAVLEAEVAALTAWRDRLREAMG